MTAAFVAGPNLVVSLPFEPDPLAVTGKPLLFRNCCSFFTSALLFPRFKLFVNLKLEL